MMDRFESTSGAVAFGAVGDGPDVVLVHGTPTSSRIWAGAIERLQSDYRIHYLDLPGYGESAMYEDQDVRLRNLAKVLAEWLEWRDLDQPILVGHDFGAAAVLGSTLVEGVEAKGICIADAVALSPWGTEFSRHVRNHEKVFAAVPEYVHTATLQAHLLSAFVTEPSPEVIDALVAPWLGTTGQPAYYRQVGQYDYEYTDLLERHYADVQVPVLIIWGDEDPWIAPDVGRKLAELIATSELEMIEGAGHFIMIEKPDEFTDQLARWLALVNQS